MGVFVLREMAYQYIALLYEVKMGMPLPAAYIRVSPFVEEILFSISSHVQN